MSFRLFGLPKLFAKRHDCAELLRHASDYLEADISERNNLIGEEPKVAARMEMAVERIRSTGRSR